MDSIIVDTNLLLVLVVGSIDQARIGQHPRTESYYPHDFRLLQAVVSRYARIVVTPNIVTETDYFLSDGIRDPLRSQLLDKLRQVATMVDERYVASREAMSLSQYRYLGVADCGLISLVASGFALVTNDSKLADAAQRVREEGVFNFTHLRTAAGILPEI